MKKIYVKPMIEIEAYELSASIAANCGKVINLGPGSVSADPCSEYGGAWEVDNLIPGFSTQTTGGTPFYADKTANCDCYYQSGGGILFTS